MTNTVDTRPFTGWEPDIPITDSLLRGFVENYAGTIGAYADSKGGDVVRTDRYLLADHGASASIFNAAVLLRPAAGDLVEVAGEIAEGFSPDGAGLVHLWSPWPTRSLESEGWKLEAHPTFAVRPIGAPLPPPASGIRVERVTDPEMLTRWERIIIDGFPLEDMQPYHPGAFVGESILDEPRAVLWVAYDGDTPAAAAELHVEHGIAGFALASTLPEHRRKGLWYALVRARLLECPDLVAASVFSSDSRPGAELIGFLPIARWTLWSRPRNGR